MNSILKIFFRQTEQLLRLTKTSLHAFQLQNNLADDQIILFDSKDNHPCVFAYDLHHELESIGKYLRSTCFLLQRALFRVQAQRQNRGHSLIQINDEMIMNYEENLSNELTHIQEMLTSIIDEFMLTKSPLNDLQILFKQIQENLEILLTSIYSMPKHKSTLYLGNLVSNTLERFYLILNNLARFIKMIEQFEMK